MKGEIMFKNTLTIVISLYRIFTVALPRLIHRGFRLLSSLPRLRFSSNRGEFAAITFGKDEVLPCANCPIVSSGTVLLWDANLQAQATNFCVWSPHRQTNFKKQNAIKSFYVLLVSISWTFTAERIIQ